MYWIDSTAMGATLESYQAAVSRMLEVCPRVERGFNEHGPLPLSFRAAHTRGDLSALLAHATGVDAGHDELVTYRKPLQITTRDRIYITGFFRVRAWADFEFRGHTWAPGSAPSSEHTDEDGYHPARPGEPAKMHASTQRIRLWLLDRRTWGLRSWARGETAEIRSLLNAAPEPVRERYAKALTLADQEVAAWREATSQARDLVTF